MLIGWLIKTTLKKIGGISKVTSKVEFISSALLCVYSVLLLWVDLVKHHYHYWVRLTLWVQILTLLGTGFVIILEFLWYPMVLMFTSEGFFKDSVRECFRCNWKITGTQQLFAPFPPNELVYHFHIWVFIGFLLWA